MNTKILFLSLFIIISGCYNFYNEYQPKNAVVMDKYFNKDTSFVISNYFLCYKNGRYFKSYETNYVNEDSILNIFKISAQKKDLKIIFDKGRNLITEEFCEYGKTFDKKHFITHIDSVVKNTLFFNDNKSHYIIPFIFLTDFCVKTNFHTGNVYVNYFDAAVMINIIKNRKIVYSMTYSGGGVTDNKTRVTDDWPNCPDPPEVFYEQAHWDTLVGLAMEDYMKRLNVEKK